MCQGFGEDGDLIQRSGRRKQWIVLNDQ